MIDFSQIFVFLVFFHSSMRTNAQDFIVDDAFNEIDDYNGVKTKNNFDLEDNGKPHDEHSQIKYLVCPELNIKRNYFTIPCDTTKDCSIGGPDLLCCESRCVKGIYASTPEPSHAQRVCPVEPIAELFPIKECKTDSECSPRICCPEKQTSVSYCRTGVPKLDKLPGAKQFIQPLKNFISYMQCTPPPPAFLDLFPKPCKTQFDCFPNLCCQENGKRFCRPPKRSILALLASVTQRFGQAEATRKFISRITV